MKNISLGLLLLLALLLSGCASNTPQKEPYVVMPLPVLKTYSMEGLCRTVRHKNKLEINQAIRGTYYQKASPEQINSLKQQVVDARNELKRRKLFSKKEWRLIEKEKIQVGMSKKALLCSWGTPNSINRSSYGPDQYVYYNQYVYLRGNRVTAWN